MSAVSLLFFVQAVLGLEVLNNPGFENANLTGNWFEWGVQLESITQDVHGGSRALVVSGRTHAYQGPGQDVTLIPGGRYRFTSYVKQLNDNPAKLFQTISVSIKYTWADTGTLEYYSIAEHPFVKSSFSWISLDGDFSAPVRNFSKSRLYFEGPDPGINFMVDDVSLQTVEPDTTWKTKADARIQRIRKNNIHVHVTKDASLQGADLEIRLDHKRHLFGFGTLINENWITNDHYKEYQNLVYGLFNWATVGAFKWTQNRGTKDNPDYKFATDAVEVLKANGMKVRGHNMFWGVPGQSPGWVEALRGDALKTAISDRVKYMTGITNGTLDHWDVTNNRLHGQLYEEKTRDPNYSEKIFDMVKKADPVSKLFLNDYNVLEIGSATEAYVKEAIEFKKANVGLYGLGLESHFRDFTPPDPTLLKLRLDKLAEAGLPLWITELDLVVHDENIRADQYETALRTFFSHPAVEGLILWGFWDHQMKSPYAALVSGDNYYVNAAGRRFIDLVHKEWSTHETHNLSDGDSFTVNGFHGDYDVVVYKNGVPIMYQEIQLENADIIWELHISDSSNTDSLPTTINPFVHITRPVDITHRGQHVIARVQSTKGSDLSCVTRESTLSAVGDDKRASVSCRDDEVITGCTSAHMNNEINRDGDQIAYANGKLACIANNGWSSTEGLKAIARCCTAKDLQCTYQSSGPSDQTVGAEVETLCQGREVATGCSAYNWNSDMEGAFPSANQKGCVAKNDGTKVGVQSYAVCCAAPRLECKTNLAQPSGQLKGDKSTATCESGYVMTGCSFRAKYGHSAGAYIEGTNCIALKGQDLVEGEEGVVAVAVCCKIDPSARSLTT